MTPIVELEPTLPGLIAEAILQDPKAASPAPKDAPINVAESVSIVTAAGA